MHNAYLLSHLVVVKKESGGEEGEERRGRRGAREEHAVTVHVLSILKTLRQTCG